MNTASLTAKPRKKLDRATVIAIGVIFAIYALAFVLEQVKNPKLRVSLDLDPVNML